MKRIISWCIILILLTGSFIFPANANDDLNWMNGNLLAANGEFFDIACHDNLCVAVGYNGVIAVSRDSGLSWKLNSNVYNDALFGAVWANNMFVCVGRPGAIFTSEDGETWTKRKSNTGSYLVDITWADNQFFACGSGGQIVTSKDGINWERHYTGFSEAIYSIVWNGDIYVAVGENGLIATSTDGLDWNRQFADTNLRLHDAVWANNRFMVVGNKGDLLTSSNGLEWDKIQTGTNENLSRIIWTGNQYVATGGDGDYGTGTVLASSSGNNWTTISSMMPYGVYAVFHTAGNYVLAGGSWGQGTITRGAINDLPPDKDTNASSEDIGDVYNASKLFKYTSVSAGDAYSLALRADGTVWSWGSNENGALGNGTFENSETPVRVKNLTDIISISAGPYHAMALGKDGAVYCWGLNYKGEAGVGTLQDQCSPVKIEGLTDVKAIAAGSDTSFALKNDGTVWGWGGNLCGELRDFTVSNGLYTNHPTPIQISDVSDVIAVSSCNSNVMAIKSDNTVCCWGATEPDLFADNLPNNLKSIAELELDNVTRIDSGVGFSSVVTSNGEIWCWGINNDGQIGNGQTTSDPFMGTPLSKVNNLNDVISISAGDSHVVAQKADGTLWGWGNNDSGQISGNSADKITSPVLMGSFTDVAGFSAGGNHTVVLKKDGSVWCIGSNRYGQLGNGSKVNSGVPVKVILPSLYSIFPAIKQNVSTWALIPVDYMWSNGLADDTLFSGPKLPITRAEFASMACEIYEKLKGTDIVPTDEEPFSDIGDSPYKESIIKAYTINVTRGSAGIFNPDQNISRQQIAVMFMNLVQSLYPHRMLTASGHRFADDEQIAPWARFAVDFVFEKKIMSGVGNNLIDPLNDTTREMAMVLAYKLILQIN